MNYEMHDNMLMEIMINKKTVQGFMDAVFGFLARRTNFFQDDKWEAMIPTESQIKSREELVMTMMRKYMFRPEQSDIPQSVTTVEVTTSSESSETIIETVMDTENEETNPIKTEEMKALQSLFQISEYYNGSACDNYCWSQTSSEIEVHVILPDNIKTSKDLKIIIEPQKIHISNFYDDEDIILEGTMREKVRNTDAVWTISKNRLQISLDKVKDLWWDKFLITENCIDVKKIDCTKPMEEFTEESQATMEKLRWDAKQKLAGLPTSDDVKNEELLRKAWNAENSPFKGQPFDPSAVKFQ